MLPYAWSEDVGTQEVGISRLNSPACVYPYRRFAAALADAIRRNLRAPLLSVEEPFAASERRKARKALDVPVLTVFWLTECGPILALHPSWYVEESVGISLTSVEVQPANPQDGRATGHQLGAVGLRDDDDPGAAVDERLRGRGGRRPAASGAHRSRMVQDRGQGLVRRQRMVYLVEG